ncbi:MAG: RNA polymerase sigma factor [Planctomycetota bacterium]|nr:RNA polymerase sigma factor [Planctomycetota bacterium]
MASPSDPLDPAVIAELYGRHARDLTAFLIGVLGSADDADEALQATFLKAVEKGHEVDRASFRAWLFRVAFNEGMLLRRKSGIRKKSLRVLADIQKKDDDSVPGSVANAELRKLALSALTQLPDEQRVVVERRIYDDMTFAAIAELLGIPLGTVLTRMRSALKKLVKLVPPDAGPD